MGNSSSTSENPVSNGTTEPVVDKLKSSAEDLLNCVCTGSHADTSVIVTTLYTLIHDMNRHIDKAVPLNLREILSGVTVNMYDMLRKITLYCYKFKPNFAALVTVQARWTEQLDQNICQEKCNQYLFNRPADGGPSLMEELLKESASFLNDLGTLVTSGLQLADILGVAELNSDWNADNVCFVVFGSLFAALGLLVATVCPLMIPFEALTIGCFIGGGAVIAGAGGYAIYAGVAAVERMESFSRECQRTVNFLLRVLTELESAAGNYAEQVRICDKIKQADNLLNLTDIRGMCDTFDKLQAAIHSIHTNRSSSMVTNACRIAAGATAATCATALEY